MSTVDNCPVCAYGKNEGLNGEQYGIYWDISCPRCGHFEIRIFPIPLSGATGVSCVSWFSMVNKEHVKRWLAGVDGWNEWRRTKSNYPEHITSVVRTLAGRTSSGRTSSARNSAARILSVHYSRI
jgi:hypothetical protein